MIYQVIYIYIYICIQIYNMFAVPSPTNQFSSRTNGALDAESPGGPDACWERHELVDVYESIYGIIVSSIKYDTCAWPLNNVDLGPKSWRLRSRQLSG